MRRAAVWISALAGAALSLGQARAADLPLEVTERGFPLVKVAINGQGPFTMVLDTAAGLTTVTTPLKDELGLLMVGRMPQPLQLAGGAETVDIYTLGFVTLAGEPAPAPITVILDAPHKYVRQARGILGMNVLSRFAIEIDQPGRRMIVHETGALPAAGHAWSVVKTDKRADYFLIVDAEIAGVKAKALIDTGANQTILNPQLAEALGIVEGAPGVTPGKLALTSGTSLKADIDNLEIGESRWDALTIQAADLPLFGALGLDEGPAFVLGNDALKQVRLFIDYAGGQVYLTPPPSAAVVGEGDTGGAPDSPAIETP